MTQKLINEIKGVIAAHDDDSALANREKQRRFRKKQRQLIIEACGLTPSQVLAGIALGVVRVRVKPSYLAECKARKKRDRK